MGERVQPHCDTHGPKATRSPIEDKSSLPASAGNDILPAITPPSPAPPRSPLPFLQGTGCLSPIYNHGIFHAIGFHSTAELCWEPLDFLTALSPACSCNQQCRSCPILALLPHPHKASLCPETPSCHMLLNRGCQIPASMQGRKRPPPQHPSMASVRPPVPRLITARLCLPFPEQGWAGMQPGKLPQRQPLRAKGPAHQPAWLPGLGGSNAAGRSHKARPSRRARALQCPARVERHSQGLRR